jgi:hypothetical protein
VAVALLSTGMDLSIHSDVFARYERRILGIEHRVDDVRNFTHSTQGMKLRQRGMIILGGIGVLVTPGDTVLNRNLFAAYPKRQPASRTYFQGRRKLQPYDSKSCCRKSADTI